MTLIHGMQKVALGGFPGAEASRLGRLLARGPGPAAAAGAALAGGAAYATRPEDSDLLSTIDRVGRAGLTGAAAGAGVGAVARRARDVQLLNQHIRHTPAELARETGASLLGDAKNVLKRQVHGLTGAYSSPRAMNDMNLRGIVPASREARLAELRGMDQGISDEAIAQQVKGIYAHGIAGERARSAGITSLPGTLRGLISAPSQTTKALWNDAVGPGGGTGGKAMVLGGYVGVPAVAGALDVARGDESEYGGQTVGRKLLRHGANVATGAVTLGLPMGAGMVAQDLLMRPFGG
jgi:hypothetical protein